jgi:hypothetical protein
MGFTGVLTDNDDAKGANQEPAGATNESDDEGDQDELNHEMDEKYEVQSEHYGL